MPGTNQFLPFAVGAGANTLTPTAYAALTSLLSSGFASGVANSAQFNTALRQATTAAAGVAQFIANQGPNVNDDGSPANFAGGLLTALQSLFVGGASFTGTNQSLANPGYQKLPGGLILVWGTSGTTDVSSGGVLVNVTFPISFPSQCFGAWGTLYRNGGTGNCSITESAPTLTGCQFALDEWAASAQSIGIRYFALGK